MTSSDRSRSWRTVWRLAKLVWSESRLLGRFMFTLPAVLPAVLATPFAQQLLGFSVPTYAAFATGFMLAALRVLWVLAGTTLRYEEQLRPKLTIEINERGALVETPEKVRNPQTGAVEDEYRAVYVRFLARAVSASAESGSVAYLVDVKKTTATGIITDTSFTDPMPLAWSHLGMREHDLPSSLGWYVDLVKTTERSGSLHFTGAWPLTLRRFFDEHTTYRFKVLISGESITLTREIDVVWNGKWDAVRASLVDSQ